MLISRSCCLACVSTYSFTDEDGGPGRSPYLVAIILLLASLMASVSAYAGPIVPPSFQGLGFLDGGFKSSYPAAISGDGTTVVGGGYSRNGAEAFVWTQSSGMVGIGDLPGGTFYSRAFGVTKNGGTVVGRGRPVDESPYPGVYSSHGYSWDSTSGFTDLGDLPGGNDQSEAYGVDADGNVIVGLSVTSKGAQPVYWKDGSGPILLDENGTGSASDVSDNGDVIVGHLNGGAVVWNSGIAMGIGGKAAYGVSPDGTHVVGHTLANGGVEAFIWDMTHGFMLLGDLGGGRHHSQAFGVSEGGQVAVGFGFAPLGPPRGKAAVIWIEKSLPIILADLLESFGVDLGGWELLSAYDVSDDGRTIVGDGRNPDGKIEAWIATISLPTDTEEVPEPKPLPFILLCLLVLAGYQKSKARTRCAG